jgi:hypothetical protein
MAVTPSMIFKGGTGLIRPVKADGEIPLKVYSVMELPKSRRL